MNNLPICPCDGFIHPAVLSNLPGQDAILYRVGSYSTFRQALLQSRSDETELSQWNPSTKRDLALQIVEWWAYLADILTFYNERIANESYLRTAAFPESVQGLTRMLGYRPRPGIGARGVVAALVNNPKSFVLPQGFQIQSKPGPGKQPQIFELDIETHIDYPDRIPVKALANPELLQEKSVLLKGSVNTIKAGDELLLMKRKWVNITPAYTLLTVKSVISEKDAQGKGNTRITFEGLPLWLKYSNAKASEYRLLKSDQYTQAWPYPTGTTNVIGSNYIHLISLIRRIKVGDPILLKYPERRLNPIQLVQVMQYKEIVWYANPKKDNNGVVIAPEISVDPPDIPIPIPHTQVSFTSALLENLDQLEDRFATLVYYNWQDIGELISTPVNVFSMADPQVSPLNNYTLVPSKIIHPVLLEDAKGNGTSATISQSSSQSNLQLSDLNDFDTEFSSPLDLLFNRLTVSHGQTVPSENLGSGNASLTGQTFSLKKSPLTYLLDPDSSSGKDYKSTLRIWVNNIEWQEVPSFYEQSPQAHIFVTREDSDQKTHVLFGDGINGARLPTGTNNIVASYRYGSGKEAPDAGTLNVIVKPYPNLKSIRNPVAVSGGADPDPPEQIRRYAPRSVLTFDRAVSGDDYATIARQAPGVARARAYWTWDADEQRSLVVIYVGDDVSAVEAAKVSLRNAADPNRPVLIKQAIGLPIQLKLAVKIDPTYSPNPVLDIVKAAFLNIDTGLFGSNAVRIGQSIYQSEIHAACLQVPGVIAVHGLQFYQAVNGTWEIDQAYRRDPGEGKFYQLAPDNLELTTEVVA